MCQQYGKSSRSQCINGVHNDAGQRHIQSADVFNLWHLKDVTVDVCGKVTSNELDTGASVSIFFFNSGFVRAETTI